MVYMIALVALFFVCFSFGFLILFFSKTRVIMIFGLFFIIVSGIILISASLITAETVLFLILGLYLLSLIILFSFRDELKIRKASEVGGKSNE